MTYIPPLNGGRINATISGNTAGAGSLVSTGTLTLAGGNNITLSQNGNAITISGGAGGGGNNTLGMSNLGNTSGTTGVISGSAIRMVYAGGNNVTLSQSLNASSGTITISAANQTVQTQNLHNLSLAGNTTGTLAQVSSGTLLLAGGNNITLSQNGNSVTISGGAGGGGIALANSQATFSSGTANLIASGALTIASTTGQSFNFSVPQTSSLAGTGIVSVSVNASTISIGAPAFSAGMSTGGNTAGNTGMATNQIVFAGGNNITLSQATGGGGNTLSIIGGGGAKTMDFHQNMDRGASSLLGTSNGTIILQPLNQENDLFAANLTANTVLLNISANFTATASSAAHSYSLSIGIYSDNATALTLINSASTTWALGANAGNTASYHGVRWLSFVSSQWSSAPTLQADGNYVFALNIRNNGVSVPMSFIGQNYLLSNQRSGTLGVANVANITQPHGPYWNAQHNSNSVGLPATVVSTQVNRNTPGAIFIPHLILNNRYSGAF